MLTLRRPPDCRSRDVRLDVSRTQVLSIKQLPIERILLGRRIKTETGLFNLVARSIADGRSKIVPQVLERLARRHARRSIALGDGVALPHAAVPGLSTARALFLRSCTPIAMSTPDDQGVTDVLALVIPSPGLAADYHLLMTLTAWLESADNRAALRAARKPVDVQALFLGHI